MSSCIQPKRKAVSRRRFVTSTALLGISSVFPHLSRAAPASVASSGMLPEAASSFSLNVEEVPVHIGGEKATSVGINGSMPAPTLRWREGDTVEIQVNNRLDEKTSIHWHGIRLPAEMDGVPGLSFSGIRAGESFTYRFPVRQNGTYWYHSHSGGQEQSGLYGAIVIDPAGRPAYEADRDYVVVLSDWTDADPMDIISNLKFNSDYYNFRQRTVGTFVSDARRNGLISSVRDRLMWGRMNMAPTDISDVSGAIYTYLMNGHAPDHGWTGLFRPGEKIRLRFINAASMTLFDVRIPGLTIEVVGADGNDVESVSVDEFRIAPAETYDVLVSPSSSGPYTIFVQSEDRTGYARGTLAMQDGVQGAVPPMDPRPMRSMTDMGMAGMAMPHSGGSMSGKSLPAAASKPEHHASPRAVSMDDMDMSGMDDMDGMDMPPSHTMSGQAHKAGHEKMKPVPHAMKTAPAVPVQAEKMHMPASAAIGSSHSVHLKPGVEVQSIARETSNRLGEAGDGLDGDGRRSLRYTDLRALRPGTDPREPSREIVLHLTGNMERFIWGFDGKKFSEAGPVELTLGERVRFVLINDTMMEHPIHLHGLWSELENGQGEYRPYKHTVIVKPGERLSYLVTADVPGMWAYHCHLLYHMETGMFRTVVVS
ncbi:copper resistance system multicopper oxidase [Acetobacter conturbans]|uniref:Copper resistance system multicopper oxidase n=1 Tax=Acetobacter conturbans TaxID=1737472 RepID=A0ABX0K6Y3_9PROT|nr:copper resistance system multicopper oxidase [Acetobacter conturbans]NHN89692.1 copper resistance system multicopper oxidase [Acetobacter conturbans]